MSFGDHHAARAMLKAPPKNMPIFDIFQDLYWHSETKGHECMKQTSFVEKCIVFMIQTEAERRRCEAGVQQSIENGLGSCMFICLYVCFAGFRKYLAI